MLSVSGMYTMYIAQLGFSKKEVSITVTLYTFASLIGRIFIGYISDKLKSPRKMMAICVSLGLVVAAGINVFTLHWQIDLLFCIWGFFVFSTFPISEGWCMANLKARNEERNFGKIRGFGSIGYGLSGPAIGLLIGNFGWRIYKWYMIAGIIIILIIIYYMKDNVVSAADKDKVNNNDGEKITIKEAFFEIIKIKELFIIIAIVFMYSFVLSGIYSYLALIVADFGGTVISLGFTYFFDATPEIFTFFLSSKLLKKYKCKSLIFVAFVLQVVRLTIILVLNNAKAVIFMGVFSGFAYGLLASSYKTYVYELAPAKYKSSCLSLAETIIGTSGIASAPIFGFIFASFGTHTAILSGLIMYIILVFILLADSLFSKRT